MSTNLWRELWSDAGRFWGRTPGRSAGLMLGCALVVALLAVNAHLFRNSLWFVPPGVESQRDFVTLGAYSAEGRFDTASAADMRALDRLGFDGRYTLYGRDKTDVAIAGRTWRSRDVAFVSDDFFSLLGVRMAAGAPSSAAKSGVVLDHEFWRTELGADRAVVGRMVQIAGVSVPVVGVSAEDFRGLGDRRPALWIPERLRAACIQIAISGEGIDVDAIKAAIAEELPVYHAVVALHDPAERARLVEWKVQTAESVDSSTDSANVTLSVNRRDFRPAVLDGIDLVPAETAAIARYLWLLSGLSVVLAILAMLNLGAYWSARTTERVQEIRIRHAVGARFGDLVRLFASEAIPFLAGILFCAIPMAWLQLKGLQSLEPFRSFLQHRFVELGARDFAPSLAAIFVIGLIAVAAPLVNVFQGSLRSGFFGASAATTRRRLAMASVQWVLVAAVAGLAGASLLAGYRMSRASWGGDGDPLLVRLAFAERRQPLLDALYVDAASAATVEIEPLGVLTVKHDAFVPGLDAKGRRLALYENIWSPAAVTQLGVPLRAGRVYAPHSENEAMVSESYARALGVAPEALLNRALVRISADGRELPPRTIVGVLGDVHYNDLRTAPEMVAYVAPEAGQTGATLLLPRSERGRIDAALRAAGEDREIAAALTSVVSMREVRDDRARTETLLSFGTFGYALLALSLLMLGVVAEARMQLAQRGRELALIVSLGARFEEAVLRFLRAPLCVAAAAIAVVSLAAAATRERWLSPFPLLGVGDLWSIGTVVLVTAVVFAVALTGLAMVRLRTLSLAELLRTER